jgi:predicted hotdog family 3-hydroxylacyl-ACP dehydratase
MLLNREQISALIPHGPSMCMLDEVLSYDNDYILCKTLHFARAQNPLYEVNPSNSVLFIEYAAQAAAVHAAITQSSLGKSRIAYLGAVKHVELLRMVSDNATPIEINARCLLNESKGAIYEIIVCQHSLVLISGRLVLNQP